MTTLPVALAIDQRATQMNMRILFTGTSRPPTSLTKKDSFLHVTQGSTMYTFVEVYEVWFLTAIGSLSVDMKITDEGLAHLLDTYAQQAAKEELR